jgi:hypothetical protein
MLVHFHERGVFYAGTSEKETAEHWPAGPCVSHQMSTTQNTLEIVHPRPFWVGDSLLCGIFDRIIISW